MDEARRFAIQQYILRLRQDLRVNEEQRISFHQSYLALERDRDYIYSHHTSPMDLNLRDTMMDSNLKISALRRIEDARRRVEELQRRIEQEEDKLNVRTELV